MSDEQYENIDAVLVAMTREAFEDGARQMREAAARECAAGSPEVTTVPAWNAALDCAHRIRSLPLPQRGTP